MNFATLHAGASTPLSASLLAIFFTASSALPIEAIAQNGFENNPVTSSSGWQRCQALSADNANRLRCFDAWAAQQGMNLPADASTPQQVVVNKEDAQTHNCKSRKFSDLSRYWELEAGSDCGTFGIRGYQPISLSWIGSDSVNSQPSSPTAGHTATTALPFNTTEMRIGLSVRTKIAQGLLMRDDPSRRDSFWFGYSQQSNWQLFNGDISRPFRTTDHEPELIYIYPLDMNLPDGWRLRYGGISLNHQSNGQSLPLSRSWNRAILMAGMENGERWRVQAKLWQRLSEDAADDDNPDIANLIGRAELTGVWNVDPDNSLSASLRHSLRSPANGSVKLEWMKKLGHSGLDGNNSGLRFHTQLFSGYGDSLIDYNRKRTVLSIGLSLVDW